MKIQLLSVTCAALLFASCSKKENVVTPTDNSAVSVDAGTTNSMSKSNAHAITGSIHYVATTSFDLHCSSGNSIPAGNYWGTGNLSHLGATTSKFEPCINPIVINGNVIGLKVVHVCGSLVAANGDELYCSSRPYSLFFTPTGAIGATVIDFVGGTGRFAHATGTIAGIVVNDNAGNSDLKDIIGTVTY